MIIASGVSIVSQFKKCQIQTKTDSNIGVLINTDFRLATLPDYDINGFLRHFWRVYKGYGTAPHGVWSFNSEKKEHNKKKNKPKTKKKRIHVLLKHLSFLKHVHKLTFKRSNHNLNTC